LDKFDVVIVGGGFAGLSTALHVCREVDATVLLIDKNAIGNPRKTSPFTFHDVVERYELHSAILQKYTRFSYESPAGISAHFQYDYVPFVTIDYQKACRTLLRRAQKDGNIEVLENTKAIKFENEKALFRPSKHKLVISNSAEITYDVLVDAAGIAFFASRQLGVRLPSLYSHAYGELLTDCNIEDPERMRIFTGRKYGNGGGWLYPLNEKTARFGFATVTTSADHPEEITRQNFKNALESFHPYNRMLEKSQRIRCELGSIPIGPLRKIVYGNIMIVGDAAGQATPWYCEGMRPALEAGELCAEAIVNAYKKKDYSTKNLNKYQELWDFRNRKLYSRTAQYGYNAWFRNQEEWDSAVKFVASLKPEEMVERIRYSRF
jgi:flavin-dependent dehydrogenase